MKRQISTALSHWKQQPDHLPLLVRGARQVGKSFIIESFGKQSLENVVTVNLEQHPECHSYFESLDPVQIVSKIGLLLAKPIQAGKTLLFIDEIQEGPKAIMALRYFKEQMPALHVIAAGSLLEFVLNSENFRMPVGRVQSYYLKPLSFYEFLGAVGKQQWVDHLGSVSLTEGVDDVLHRQLLDHLRQYLVMGGMPAVIESFINDNDYNVCQERQAAILNTYRNDFGKYAKKIAFENLQTLFQKVPGFVGEQIKYSRIDAEVKSRDMKYAIQCMEQAGLIYPIYHTNASGLPFYSGVNDNKFKLLFLDVGLVQYQIHLSSEILLAEDILLLNRGGLAEQFVGQELLAYTHYYEAGELYYWTREKQSSKAEIDFVVNVGSQILPVEVKSGKTGRLKSMQVFLKEKNLALGLRISSSPLLLERNILSIPLYMIAELARLVEAV